MSWDVFIMPRDSTTEGIVSFEDLSDEFHPPPMGEASDVRDKIRHVLPAVNWADPAWGMLEGDGFTIEFNFQKEGVVDGFVLHVRGSGDPLAPITLMCKVNEWMAFDCSDGSVIDLDDPSRESWELFQQYRDRVLAQPEDDESNES